MKFRIFFIILISLPVVFSLRTQANSACLDSRDSLSSNIDLGFHTKYYIVGRLKTTEIFTGIPFKVAVKSVAPEFIDKEIRFKILDPYKYSMGFILNGEEKTIIGSFGKSLKVPAIEAMVSKTDIINKSEKPKELCATLKNIDYVFKIGKR